MIYLILIDMKRFILSACLLVFGAMHLGAQEVVYSLNDEDGVYSAGDKVVVYAEATEDVSVTYDIMNSGVDTLDTRTVKLKKGKKKAVYSKKHKETCHIVLNLSYEGLETPVAVGFVVAPENFTAGYDCPPDLREFWDDQVAQLRKLPIESSLVKVTKCKEKGFEKTECHDLTLNMPEGRPVRGYMALPKDAEKGSLPIIIFAHSAGVNKHFNYATPERAVQYSKYGRGCISVDINAHGMENAQPQEYYDGLYNGELNRYPDRKITGHKDYYFRLMFLRLVRTLDYLTTLPEWDGKTVLVYGESQGGAQAMALSGIDNRVTACVAIVPAMNDLGASKQGRPACWPKARNSRMNKDNPLADEILPYYDAALLSTMSKADYWIEIGLVDKTCPPPAIWTAINVIKGKCIVHTFPFRPHHRPVAPYLEDWKKTNYDPRIEWMNEYLSIL